MTLAEIQSRLEQVDEIKGKVAQFEFKTEKKVPYCLFFRSGTSDIGADNAPSALREEDITIELYTGKIDLQLEEKIENQFKEFRLDKNQVYISNTKEYMTTWVFTQYPRKSITEV